MICEVCKVTEVSETALVAICEACAERVWADRDLAERVSREMAISVRHTLHQIRQQLPITVRWSANVPGNTCDVLVVDDDEAIRLSMTEVLESEGLTVRTAINGHEGLELAHALRPKIIVLDMMMPVMNGWEFLTALQADADLKRIPVVQMSAYLTASTPPYIHRLRKPFQQEELLKAVKNHVGIAHA